MEAKDVELLLQRANAKILQAEQLIKTTNQQRVSDVYKAQLYLELAKAMALVALAENLHKLSWRGVDTN